LTEKNILCYTNLVVAKSALKKGSEPKQQPDLSKLKTTVRS